MTVVGGWEAIMYLLAMIGILILIFIFIPLLVSFSLVKLVKKFRIVKKRNVSRIIFVLTFIIVVLLVYWVLLYVSPKTEFQAEELRCPPYNHSILQSGYGFKLANISNFPLNESEACNLAKKRCGIPENIECGFVNCNATDNNISYWDIGFSGDFLDRIGDSLGAVIYKGENNSTFYCVRYLE